MRVVIIFYLDAESPHMSVSKRVLFVSAKVFGQAQG